MSDGNADDSTTTKALSASRPPCLPSICAYKGARASSARSATSYGQGNYHDDYYYYYLWLHAAAAAAVAAAGRQVACPVGPRVSSHRQALCVVGRAARRVGNNYAAICRSERRTNARAKNTLCNIILSSCTAAATTATQQVRAAEQANEHLSRAACLLRRSRHRHGQSAATPEPAAPGGGGGGQLHPTDSLTTDRAARICHARCAALSNQKHHWPATCCPAQTSARRIAGREAQGERERER